MVTISVVPVAAYRWIWGLDRLAWSKGRQPPGARAALANGTGWTFAVAIHCYADSTINIVAAITTTTSIPLTTSKKILDLLIAFIFDNNSFYEGRSINKLQNSHILLVFPNIKNRKYTFCRKFNSE